MEIPKTNQELKPELEEISTTINTETILSLDNLTDHIIEIADSYDLEKQKQLTDYIKKSIFDNNIGLFNTNKIIQSVFQYLTYVYDDYQGGGLGFYKKLEEILKQYRTEANNFFLKQVVNIFLQGKEYKISPETKRNIIKDSWEENAYQYQGDTIYETSSGVRYKFNRIIGSFEEITDDEINAIFEILSKEDELFFSKQTLYEFDAIRKYEDSEIENNHIITDLIPPMNFEDHQGEIYDIYSYRDRLNKTFFTKIDDKTGGVYKNGELKNFFLLNKEMPRRESKTIGFSDIKNITYIIADLDQASLGYLDNIKTSIKELKSLKDVVPEDIINAIESLPEYSINENEDEFNYTLKDLAEETREKLENFLFENISRMREAKKIQISETLDRFGKEGNPDDFAHLYQTMMSLRVRTFLEDYFNINLSDFSLNTQAQFLRFISSKQETEIEQVKYFLNKEQNSKSKTERFATFLSLDYGQDMGEKIIKIAETLPEESSCAIFAKYSEITNASEDVLYYIREQFGDAKNYNQELVNEIQEKILKKGRDILVDFADEASAKKEKGEEVSHEEVLLKLNNIKIDTLLFLYSFKAAKKSGLEIDLEHLKDIEFTQSESSLISEEDKKRMREIYMLNYMNKPELMDLLMKKFGDSLESENNTFHILRHKDMVRGFYRIEKREKENLYFGAFNIDPEYQGSALGETMLEQSLDYYGKSEFYTIEADVIENEPIASNYIERGFIAEKQYPLKEINALNIFWNESWNHLLFHSKQFSKESIIDMAKVGKDVEFYDGDIIISARPVSDISSIPFEKLNQEMDGKRYVLTRYIREKTKDDETVYATFEKISDEHLKMYKENIAPDFEEEYPADPRGRDYFIV